MLNCDHAVAPAAANDEDPTSTNSRVLSQSTSTKLGTERHCNGIEEMSQSDILEMNTDQNGKAKEIMLFSFSRPHMRAFHCSWWGFFIAFFIWFAIAPLLPEIRKDLKLTKQELWTSSIIGVGGTILVRFILGPLCDKYGSRKLFTLILCTASIPTAMTGLVHSASDLYILRACIGIVGGTFVMCQHWTVCMFADEIVGTANGIVAGWGNLGGGVTQLIMGSVLFPLFTTLCGSTEQAWRTVSIVPAVVAFSTGLAIYFFSETMATSRNEV